MIDSRPEYSIANLLDKTLIHINAVYEQAGVSLPTRQYLYAGDRGETVHDCEQVTVSFAQAYSGSPGEQLGLPQKCNTPRSAIIYVEVVRCITDKPTTRNGRGVAPEPSAFTATAITQAVDAWLLLEAAMLVGDDFLGTVATVSPGAPSGGYQAIVLELTAGIE